MDRDVIINNGHFAFKAAFDEHEVVMRGIENVEIKNGIVYVEYPDGTIKAIGALYATVHCTTAAATEVKEVTLQSDQGTGLDNIVLQEGNLILVSFENTNTHNAPKLQFNNMAALPIMQDGLSVSKGDLFENRLYALCYRVDHYDIVGLIELGRKPATTVGEKSLAFGNDVEASGQYSQAFGDNTKASAKASHAEGNSYIDRSTGSPQTVYTTAQGEASHAEGSGTTAIGDTSHAEGQATIAKSPQSHAEGFATYAGDEHSDENGFSAHAEGSHTRASGNASHAEGISSMSYGAGAHTEGYTTTAQGNNSHAEGDNTVASADSAHAEGARYNNKKTTASATAAHAEGEATTASGEASHTEGRLTTAVGIASHSEGNNTTANAAYSHAEGLSTFAGDAASMSVGVASHAEGTSTKASADSSHAEGNLSEASGEASHAEGFTTKATGISAHAEGWTTIAAGTGAHVEGYGTKANAQGQHVEGKYNVESNAYLHVVGNGTADNARSNAHILTNTGEAHFKGNVFVQASAADASDGLQLATLASPALTGTPTAPTAAKGTSTTQLATTAFVMNAFEAADAMIFKGVIAGGADAAHTAYTPAADKGHTYKISPKGYVNGYRLETGDMLICTDDSTPAATASNVNTVKEKWVRVQADIDGAVTGPETSTANNIAAYTDSSGKIIKDSGKKFVSSIPVHDQISDNDIPSNAAVESYIVAWLDYKQIAINTLTVEPTLAEKGSTVSSVKLTYALNKDATAMKLDSTATTNDAGTMSASGTITKPTSLTANKTWTLWVQDTRPDGSHREASKTASTKFVNRVFYGAAAVPTMLNSSFVRGLSSNPLDEDGVVSGISITTGTDEYMWYASTVNNLKFNVGGFDGGFETPATVQVKNAGDVDTTYYVYRSTYSNLGTRTVTVKK